VGVVGGGRPLVGTGDRPWYLTNVTVKEKNRLYRSMKFPPISETEKIERVNKGGYGALSNPKSNCLILVT